MPGLQAAVSRARRLAVAGAVLGLVTHGALGQDARLPTGRDSTVYVLSPRSVLEVRVGKSGLLSGFGHEHRIRAHAVTGEIVYFPVTLGRSRVSVTVLTDSLRVVPAGDAAHTPQIPAPWGRQRLTGDSSPESPCVARGGARAATAAGPLRIRVTGDLTMVG